MPAVDSIRLVDVFSMLEGIIYRRATERDTMRLREDEVGARRLPSQRTVTRLLSLLCHPVLQFGLLPLTVVKIVSFFTCWLKDVA